MASNRAVVYAAPNTVVGSARVVDYPDDVAPLDLHNHRALNHWIVGNAALFVGDGVCATVSENIKTAIQLKAVDMSEGFPTDHLHMQPATNGIYTNFWKSMFLLGSRWVGNFNVDKHLTKHNMPLPWPLVGAPGVIIGTLVTYPLDLVRTRQGEATFAPLVDKQKKRKVSVFRVYDNYGFGALWKGVELGLLYNLAQHTISKMLEGYAFHPDTFSAISPAGMKPQVASFFALTVAKILLNPIEIAKKRAQQDKIVITGSAEGGVQVSTAPGLVDTLSLIYKEEGLAGLFAGWYMSIPEAFSTVIVTHVTYAAVKYFVRKYYESRL